MSETPGQRLYLIRLACGDGVRTPEPMKTFAARVGQRTGAVYHANAISLLERDEQGWRLDDVTNFAAVDPKHRGREWLAFGGRPQILALDPTLDRGLTEEEEQRAREAAAAQAAARKPLRRGASNPAGSKKKA